MGIIGTYFVNEGISKEQAERIEKKLDVLLELETGKKFKTESFLSWILEKENITQDKLDELINLLKSFGKQKGFKV